MTGSRIGRCRLRRVSFVFVVSFSAVIGVAELRSSRDGTGHGRLTVPTGRVSPRAVRGGHRRHLVRVDDRHPRRPPDAPWRRANTAAAPVDGATSTRGKAASLQASAAPPGGSARYSASRSEPSSTPGIRWRLVRGRPQQCLPHRRRRHFGHRRVHRPVAGEFQARRLPHRRLHSGPSPQPVDFGRRTAPGPMVRATLTTIPTTPRKPVPFSELARASGSRGGGGERPGW